MKITDLPECTSLEGKRVLCESFWGSHQTPLNKDIWLRVEGDRTEKLLYSEYIKLKKCMVSPTKDYDEDLEELICKDVEFNYGDYFDLSKHSDEQIRHISEYYKFYDVEDLFSPIYRYKYIFFDGNDGDFVGVKYTPAGKEYHYNDLFY